MPVSPFHIEVHDRVDDLSDDWPDANDGNGCALFVFQSKTFLRAWEATYGKARKAQLCLVEVRDQDQRPVLFVPLYIQQQHGARVLAFTDDGVADYNAPILFDHAQTWDAVSADALLQGIVAALPPFDIAAFDKMPETVEGRPNPFWYISNRDCAEATQWITLDRPLPDIEASIRGLRTIKKRGKALRQAGRYRFLVTRTAEERATILDAMLRQKQRRFVETRVPGFDAHPEKRQFFETVTEPLAARNALHFSALTMDDEVVATMWSVTRNRHYCAMVTTFEDGVWNKYSPGKVLILRLIEALKADDYDCFDLGFGNEPWKQDFANRTIPLRDYIAARTPRGKLSLARQQLITSLRSTRLYQRLRPLKWELLRRFSR
ncbi:GNAT family N-acetyltransferase [Ochrobactrum sp. Q0168]|uniref:GNAT family N-acetyltransferase n=1 Tax=Ochrobactrum sp. Q0168 TaxID=2793241 RepID=UPI0018EB3DBA|nr:GNAT family N-acetyltransferase [Ochrobactrum sp. Q0168]